MAVKHETKIVELAMLTPYENNPNVHPIEQIEALAKSIEKYGQYYSIIVDENMKILCGHGKKLALEHLGRKECEVKILKGLSEKQKLKLIIEDNKVQSMSYVNFSKIEEIIKEIGDTEIIGFNVDYLDTIINENVKDNMGIDFSKPMEHKSNDKQIDDIPQERQEGQDDERNDFEDGMQSARTIICPHCGKEIVI